MDKVGLSLNGFLSPHHIHWNKQAMRRPSQKPVKVRGYLSIYFSGLWIHHPSAEFLNSSCLCLEGSAGFYGYVLPDIRWRQQGIGSCACFQIYFCSLLSTFVCFTLPCKKAVRMSDKSERAKRETVKQSPFVEHPIQLYANCCSCWSLK